MVERERKGRAVRQRDIYGRAHSGKGWGWELARMLAGNGDSTSQPTCGTAPSADNQPRRQIRLNIGDWNKRKEGKMKLTYYPSRPYHYFLYLYLPPPLLLAPGGCALTYKTLLYWNRGEEGEAKTGSNTVTFTPAARARLLSLPSS